MSIGKKIRALREKRNLKQNDLANALQVSHQAVSKWERDENEPDGRTIVKLSKLLSVTTDYLLGASEQDPGIFEATVLCTSLNQFARKSIELNPQEVAEWANVIFHHLTESVLKFDGIPIKYVGDGFLCFFSGANHAKRAIDASIHAKRVIQSRELIINIHSGEVYLDSIGHPDYSRPDIYGKTVNTAFLLMDWVAENVPSGVAATQATVNRTEDIKALRPLQEVPVPLVNERIKMWEVGILSS